MSGGPSAVHSRRPQAAVLPQEVIASPGPSNLRPKHAVPDTPDQGWEPQLWSVMREVDTADQQAYNTLHLLS